MQNPSRSVRVVATLMGLFTILWIGTQYAHAHTLKERFIEELTRDTDGDRRPDFNLDYITSLFDNLGTLHRNESDACMERRENIDADIARKRRGEEPITWYLLVEEHSLRLGIEYYQMYRTYFERAEREYDISPEIILGIFRMENWFGVCIGAYHALPALFYTFQDERKSWQWTIDEMRALIRYCNAKECDPNTLPSSERGALGYAQFLPSNFFKYAVDGNGDGEVDLFAHPDAIMSTGRFLAERGGWIRGLDREQQKRAVWHYNPTYYAYVDPVFQYADAIRPLLQNLQQY